MIIEFKSLKKGKLDPDEFLEWLHTVECIFEYKDVSNEKNANLVALRLWKYASSLWINICVERVRRRKSKIRTREKTKAKLKSWFLPSNFNQDGYSQLHNLRQPQCRYTHEFEKLLIKCEIQEAEEQSIVRHLEGLEPK